LEGEKAEFSQVKWMAFDDVIEAGLCKWNPS
jgi:hypothetical protein